MHFHVPSRELIDELPDRYLRELKAVRVVYLGLH
jgi:hypothetical protein